MPTVTHWPATLDQLLHSRPCHLPEMLRQAVDGGASPQLYPCHLFLGLAFAAASETGEPAFLDIRC